MEIFSIYFTFYCERPFFKPDRGNVLFSKHTKKFSGWDAQKWYLYCTLIRIKCKILAHVCNFITIRLKTILKHDISEFMGRNLISKATVRYLLSNLCGAISENLHFLNVAKSWKVFSILFHLRTRKLTDTNFDPYFLKWHKI